MLLGGLVMMTACNKENTNEQLGIPEGALMLTTEGYVGDGKTVVEDAEVAWVNGDEVTVNGTEYTVTVTDGDIAYINASELSAPVYGYYACGTIGEGSSVDIPSTYTCRYVDGKQVIALPMAAYTASVGSVIPFKHLTAAVKVRVWNDIESTTLVLDRVVVKSSTYLLSKEGKAITFAGGVPTVTPEATNTENAVTVTIEGNATIASGSILDVQVPILPIGSGNDEELTIEVYTHETGNVGHTYTFSFTDGVPQGLARNAMLTAGCKIHTGTGNHVNEFDALNTPLTFEAKTANVDVYFTSNTTYAASLEYSTDGGTSWTGYTNGDHITLYNAGDKVSFRGDNTSVTATHEFGTFGSTGDCYLYGNVMSLLSSNGYPNLTELPCQYIFRRLFLNNIDNPTIFLYSHTYKTLVLPATTLTVRCYDRMFLDCEHLTTAPVLPATVLANDCYAYMFSGCTSLTEAPALPATTLTQGCYNGMFVGCSSLTKAPDLSEVRTMSGISCCQEMFVGCTSLTTTPAMPTRVSSLQRRCYQGMFRECTSLTTVSALFGTSPTLAEDCCHSMFEGCTSLTTAPALAPANSSLKMSCYYAMFKGCTSLTATPDLPACSLARECYQSMFEGCTSLTTVPEILPATGLQKNCYEAMFKGCTSLTTAPALPATTFAGSNSDCYRHMFYGCSNLSSVSCSATRLNGVTAPHTTDWLLGVASSGTFHMSASVSFEWPSGASGIPEGWTVENDL